MKNITMTKVLSWGPCGCYTKDDAALLRRFLPPRRGLTPLEICDLTEVPVADRLWVLLREEVIPARELRLLACRWAEEALWRERRAGREPDPRSWAAIEVSRRYADENATQQELSNAELHDAWIVASDVACGIIPSAVGDVARVLARAAAGSAAWAAAGDVVIEVSGDVIEDETLDQKLVNVRELLMRLGA